MLTQGSKPSLRAGKGTTKDFLKTEATRIGGDREEHKVQAQESSGKSSFTQTKVANDGSKSKLAAKDVFLAEKRAAQDAIQRQEIPAGYREYVRKYFEGIQPDQP